MRFDDLGCRSCDRPRGRRTRAAARAAASAARSGSGARPSPVCRITPVALITRTSPLAATDAAAIARARISSSSGGSAPRSISARTSSSVAETACLSSDRPNVAAGPLARLGSEERVHGREPAPGLRPGDPRAFALGAGHGAGQRTTGLRWSVRRRRGRMTNGGHRRARRLHRRSRALDGAWRRRRHRGRPARDPSDRGDDPQHRPAAPLDARGAPDHPRVGRRGDRPGGAGDRLHAPRGGEARRVPRRPPGPRAHEPARLAVRVQQRARVGARGRAARRARGPRARELDPNDARRVEPRPQPSDVHGLVPAGARRDDPDLLRVHRAGD